MKKPRETMYITNKQLHVRVPNMLTILFMHSTLME